MLLFFEAYVFLPPSLDLPMEYNPSDHPRASTIFLSKSQTDGEFSDLSEISSLTYIWGKQYL